MKQQKPGMDTLIVPGYQGSGPDHWQSWLEERLPGSRRITGIAWDKPVLAAWAERVRNDISRARQPLWLIAHSFGCLATVVAVADRPDNVAGLILVAPASPKRFDFMGLRPDSCASATAHSSMSTPTLAEALPRRALRVPGLLLASRNDPWLPFTQARSLAKDWGLAFHDAGPAGHINAESGYGPWPWLLDLVSSRQGRQGTPTSALKNRQGTPTSALKKGRGSALATVRQLTRRQLEKLPRKSRGQTR
ncbi:MAG: alpha/beta hydrolase [Pseudomonadales bacterium]|nr:alpha/beta hydrolase [Pseudomonadales bacterium]